MSEFLGVVYVATSHCPTDNGIGSGNPKRICKHAFQILHDENKTFSLLTKLFTSQVFPILDGTTIHPVVQIKNLWVIPDFFFLLMFTSNCAWVLLMLHQSIPYSDCKGASSWTSAVTSVVAPPTQPRCLCINTGNLWICCLTCLKEFAGAPG